LLLQFLHEQQKVACMAAQDSCLNLDEICFWRIRNMLCHLHCVESINNTVTQQSYDSDSLLQGWQTTKKEFRALHLAGFQALCITNPQTIRVFPCDWRAP